ncbi:hypothetical protein B5M09_011569 [Aphanomyces astaci]|uniref:DUF7769 domain-containing protein n=1 Tax=Aphanomyces astaci TaxID=112090 RepID=A0A425CRA6_APHAT|nr:hypothetical protein B5M09_011569 [Aphanomyces astaci]
MRAKPNLTDIDRNAILQQLLTRMVDHKTLVHGSLKDLAKVFNVNRTTVSRTWKRAMVDFTNTTRPCSSVASRIKGQSGRNFKHVSVAERLKKIPKTQRTTFRSIAAAMNMSRSTLHAYYKRGIFVKYTSTVRPLLTDANKATTDMEEKVEELAVEISAALDMGEFCSQIERLGVDDELDEDLLEILGLDIE